MPKLKYEFMNEYYKSHRRPWHDYLFGYFHVVSKWLAPVAPLANALMKMAWSRKLIAQVMGITDKREFPVFTARRSQIKRDLLAVNQSSFYPMCSRAISSQKWKRRHLIF